MRESALTTNAGFLCLVLTLQEHSVRGVYMGAGNRT